MKTKLMTARPIAKPRYGSVLHGVVLALSVILRPGAVLADDPTPAQIQDAIDKGKAFLYSKQFNGNWEVVATPKPSGEFPNNPSGLQFGGMTALATFALLSCGDTPSNNDNVKAAVEWLKKVDMRGTYALGLRSQIWNLLPEDESIKKVRKRDKELLLAGIHTKGEATSFYSYGEGVDMTYGQSTSEQYDHSVSQFGVLGLWSLVQAGEEVDTHYWRDFDKAWRGHQMADGGWGYRMHTFPDTHGQTGQGGELLSMTAAGVATLFITQDYANLSSKCEGNIKDPNIDAGMAWIGSHFKAIDANEWSQTWHYYTMFGICRIGLASGYKYIGSTDWFKWGAAMLLKDQGGGGSWGSGGMMSFGRGTDPVDPGVYDTSFALLFLARGRAPVLFNKLQYDVLKSGAKKPSEGVWNERPRDVANLTRFIGKQSETNLNWQIVNLRQDADDLLDAPMMYMAGNQPFKMAPADIARLKEYVDKGGILVGHADCGQGAFSESFKKLGETMYPGEKFRDMPADYPICKLENFQARNWKRPPRVEILDNGARLRMLLLASGDPAREWQTQSFLPMKEYAAGQLMMDIYLYAVDKQPPRVKGDTFIVKKDQGVSASSTAKVARIQYAGNWDPEPGGWPRLANIMHNKNQIDLTITPVELGKGLLTNDYKLADLTGTAAFKLTDAQAQELKKYVEGGGTLLIDSCGGKSAFNESAEDELARLFTGSKVVVLPKSSPLYAVGEPVTDVTYRQFARMALGNLHSPQLRGIDIGGRVGVLFSREDLAVGLVGQPVDGILGYDPTSAAHLVQNIVLYATKAPAP
jgi:hypothetical protein